MKKKVIAVVPARMASSRFPDKPLAKILDLPMVEHVRRRALLAHGIDEVVVATCDQSIMDVVLAAGGRAIMTADTHQRASDRVAEAMHSLTGDIVVVVQGDEPTLLPDMVYQTAQPLLERDEVQCVSLLSRLDGPADFANPNIVKAACDQHGQVMFLSRAPIPYFQKSGVACPIYRETGLRAFRADFLQTYCALAETPFEKAESVDMLRVLEHGYHIVGVVTDHATLGVDHFADIPIAEDALRTDPVQREIYQQTLHL